MKIHKLFLTMAALAILTALPSSAKADFLTFSISDPIQSGTPGSLLTFNGFMQNGPGMITNIGLSDSLDPLLSVNNIFFPGTLGSGALYTGPLFEIMIDSSATSGQVLAGTLSFTYLNSDGSGGTSVNAQDIVVTVIQGGPAPIPEPTTMILLGTGLAGVAAARRRKRRKAHTP